MHPEMEEQFPEFKEIANAEVVDVWCKGCADWRKMNAKYAKIIGTGEIESCSQCDES
jgi:hypothetical protein